MGDKLKEKPKWSFLAWSQATNSLQNSSLKCGYTFQNLTQTTLSAIFVMWNAKLATDSVFSTSISSNVVRYPTLVGTILEVNLTLHFSIFVSLSIIGLTCKYTCCYSVGGIQMSATSPRKYLNLTAHITFPREVAGTYFIPLSVLGTWVVCERSGTASFWMTLSWTESILPTWSAGHRFLSNFVAGW